VKRLALLLGVSAAAAQAQDVSVGAGASRPSGVILREAMAKPHVLRTGTGRLDLPRDSTVGTTLVVLGRPTYVAGKVNGDVIVVGSDLFLRPGSAISGRAIAIGGTVATTTLGTVSGDVESFRDESYAIAGNGGGYTLDFRGPRAAVDATPLIQPAGLQGLLMPTYERVDGLSLPIGALATLGALEVEPSITYRSRLGTVDPAVAVRLNGESVRFVGAAGRTTRTNDAWNYSDLVNSAVVFYDGNDSRNYFRSNGGEGRVIGEITGQGFVLEPYVGGRYERVSPITATGDVWSLIGRADTEHEHIRRFNPLVEKGSVGSALVGFVMHDTAGTITSRLRIDAEQSFTTPASTSNFTQLTLDGHLEFPTFGLQRLAFRGHAVATIGDSVPLARYTYLGGSGTLPVLNQLEMGGPKVVFLESDYSVPLVGVVLPFVGIPVLQFRHIMGAAGVSKLPKLEQEIGAGIGLSAVHFDVNTDVARHRGTKFGVGISLTK
jgi:hypothetical protein